MFLLTIVLKFYDLCYACTYFTKDKHFWFETNNISTNEKTNLHTYKWIDKEAFDRITRNNLLSDKLYGFRCFRPNTDALPLNTESLKRSMVSSLQGRLIQRLLRKCRRVSCDTNSLIITSLKELTQLTNLFCHVGPWRLFWMFRLSKYMRSRQATPGFNPRS